MRKVWIIAWNNLYIILQSKQSWLLLIGIPILVIYLVGIGAQGFAQSVTPLIRLDVLDLDDSAASKSMIVALREANPAFLLCPMDQDASDRCALAGEELSPKLVRERLERQVTSALITIPEGFDLALESGGKTTITFQPGVGLVAPEIVFWSLQNAVTRVGGPFVAARLSTQLAAEQGIRTDEEFYAKRLAEAQYSWSLPPVRVKATMAGLNEKMIYGAQLLKNGFKVSAPNIAVMFVMISLLGMAQSLVEERMIGVLRRTGMMPVNRAQLLGGKLLAIFLLGWLQFAVLLTFGEWLGVGLSGAPIATMIVVSAYVLAVTALALTCAALVNTPGQASALTIAIWLVLVPLGGAWWPLLFVPPWMRTLGHLSPVAWCLDALNSLVFFHGTWKDVLIPSITLILFAGVFFAIGLRRLRY